VSLGSDAYKTAIWAANCKMSLIYLKDIAKCFANMEEHELKAKIKRIGREVIAKAVKRLPDDLYKQIAGEGHEPFEGIEGTV